MARTLIKWFGNYVVKYLRPPPTQQRGARVKGGGRGEEGVESGTVGAPSPSGAGAGAGGASGSGSGLRRKASDPEEAPKGRKVSWSSAGKPGTRESCSREPSTS